MSEYMKSEEEKGMDSASNQSYESYYEENGACGCTPSTCGCSSEKSASQSGDLPAQYQILREGDRVVEFGTTNGIESLTASYYTGKSGKVIGICDNDRDIYESWTNSDMVNVNNVEFRKSELHDVPVQDAFANVTLGNKILNKIQDKSPVVAEAYRVLKEGGMACFSEFVYFNELPEEVMPVLRSFVDHLDGIEKMERLLLYFDKQGFQNLQIVEMKKMILPEDQIATKLSGEALENFQDPNSYDGIFSITFIADKPGEGVEEYSAASGGSCCGGGCGCS